MVDTVYIGKVVRFLPKIAEEEVSYVEPGMLARVIRVIDVQGDYTKLHVNYADFESRNKPLETFHYYDDNGNPTLSARQKGHYNVEDEIYMPMLSEYPLYLEIVAESDAEAALSKEYQERTQNELSYVQWLENELWALRKNQK
jgi:hypothetical protein